MRSGNEKAPQKRRYQKASPAKDLNLPDSEPQTNPESENLSAAQEKPQTPEKPLVRARPEPLNREQSTTRKPGRARPLTDPRAPKTPPPVLPSETEAVPPPKAAVEVKPEIQEKAPVKESSTRDIKWPFESREITRRRPLTDPRARPSNPPPVSAPPEKIETESKPFPINKPQAEDIPPVVDKPYQPEENKRPFGRQVSVRKRPLTDPRARPSVKPPEPAPVQEEEKPQEKQPEPEGFAAKIKPERLKSLRTEEKQSPLSRALPKPRGRVASRTQSKSQAKPPVEEKKPLPPVKPPVLSKLPPISKSSAQSKASTQSKAPVPDKIPPVIKGKPSEKSVSPVKPPAQAKLPPSKKVLQSKPVLPEKPLSPIKPQPSKAPSTRLRKEEHRKPSTRMIFAHEAGYNIAAVVEEKRFTDFWIQEEKALDTGKTGNIYRGVVSNVLPSLNAAFVNIGLEKDGFLGFDDLAPDFQLLTGSKKKQKVNSIEDVLREGDSILVQIAKEPIADKGPSLTRKISIPGRFLVYMPGADAVRMSRMLSDADKERFHEVVKNEFDFEGGLIFRTASQGKNAVEIQQDLRYLTKIWNRVLSEFEAGDESKLIHKELDLFERVLRDNFSLDTCEIMLDHPRLKYRIAQFLKVIAPDNDPDSLIQYHTDKTCSVWKAQNLSKDLDRLFSKRIHLDCGGYIIIEEMETLTAIDVNTGKNITGKSMEETIFETNLEAAKEIPRQLRLRQIGGIIIIDFIDMRLKRHKDKVFQVLQSELEKDRTASDIQEFSEFGLVQITRQRSGKSLTSQLTYSCPHCDGRGRRPTFAFE